MRLQRKGKILVVASRLYVFLFCKLGSFESDASYSNVDTDEFQGSFVCFNKVLNLIICLCHCSWSQQCVLCVVWSGLLKSFDVNRSIL